MKQTLLLTIFICLLDFIGKAQEHLPTAEDYSAFAKTKTLIVLDNNPMSEYNFRIKDVIKNNWTITEYGFISNKEFEKKRFDSKYSFIINSIVTFNKDKTKARYNFLSLVMGGKQQRIANMPDLCSVPLSYKHVHEDVYLYKLPCFIRFMQNHVKLVSKNPEIISANVLKYYNKNASLLQGKTLYLIKEELQKEVNSLAKIRKIYPGKVKIVTKEEVEEAINGKKENVVFLHKVGPESSKIKARCFKILVGASDSDFYYFDYHMIKKNQSDSFLEKDFKRIAR
ncbi:hypothetical protein [Marinifilum fragile]|uniref:hypothetical protein n=1 Tax=Marinifilum fragile TaxID=570161 RepID=UPI002AA83BD6|nr:hypothetical protein [Marinifilum fragile]